MHRAARRRAAVSATFSPLHLNFLDKLSGTDPRAGTSGFRNEIRDAADSAARNIAEGFGRYSPPQFAQFLDVSRASAMETRSLLKKGLAVGYWRQEDYERVDALATRGLQAVAKFQRYLRSPQARRNAERHRYGRQRITPGSTNENDPNENDPNAPNDPNDPNA